uniref:MFS domain-containing protein n=1 Tax=Angiostrongylus cantonensis TaxID=6313 RepID=A0A158PA97_ANGCA
MTNVNAVVFVVTFLSYGLYHSARKNLSEVKTSITHDWMDNTTHFPLFVSREEANTFLGSLDAAFMIAYAFALFFWGWLGDRLNPKHVVVTGMVGSAVMLILFGCLPVWCNFYNIPYYMATYFVFGLVQACGWPNEIAIMANWFDKSNRGFVMGIWASCQPVGNVFGSFFIAWILPHGYEVYCLCNVCLKLVNYAFFFWLPLYLTETYHWKEYQLNYSTTIWPVRLKFKDKIGCRTPVVVIMLFSSIGSLFFYTHASSYMILNAVIMMMVGVTVSGPYNLIVSTISIDLGSQPDLASNEQAMSTVTGLLDGTGSIGSAVGQFFIPIMQKTYGWSYVFYLFMALVSVCGLLMNVQKPKTVEKVLRKVGFA